MRTLTIDELCFVSGGDGDGESSDIGSCTPESTCSEDACFTLNTVTITAAAMPSVGTLDAFAGAVTGFVVNRGLVWGLVAAAVTTGFAGVVGMAVGITAAVAVAVNLSKPAPPHPARGAMHP